MRAMPTEMPIDRSWIWPSGSVTTVSRQSPGVGQKVVASIIDDLKATASRKADAVFNALPAAFPHALTDSVRGGIAARLARLDTGDPEAP